MPENNVVDFNKLVIGTQVHEKDCILSDPKDFGDKISATLTDETGSICCFINKNLLKAFPDFAGKEVTVRVNGSYTFRGKNVLAIKRIALSDAKINKPQEFFSEETIQNYVNWIHQAAEKVAHPGYKQLLSICLTDDFIKKLIELPATLANGGIYPGGAMQQTCTVMKFVGSVGCDYVRYGNGSYSRGCNWDAVITATLLQFYGNMKYYFLDEESGKILKTDYGLHSGYYATLGLELQKIILTNNVPITDTEFSFLLNILGASVRGGKNGVRAVSKEGMLLKAMNDAFVALDTYDSEYARLTKKNTENGGENLPYLYSDRLDAYIVVGQKEEPERKEGNE